MWRTQPTIKWHYIKDEPNALDKPKLSSHELLIETGRYTNGRLERNERKYTFCDMNDLEDEYRFVLVCPAYADLR